MGGPCGWPLRFVCSQQESPNVGDFSRVARVLDFSHLRVKGVGYARHRSRPKEVSELRTLPTQMIRVLLPFVPLFSERVFRHAQVLLVGAFPQLRAQGP